MAQWLRVCIVLVDGSVPNTHWAVHKHIIPDLGESNASGLSGYLHACAYTHKDMQTYTHNYKIKPLRNSIQEVYISKLLLLYQNISTINVTKWKVILVQSFGAFSL